MATSTQAEHTAVTSKQDLIQAGDATKGVSFLWRASQDSEWVTVKQSSIVGTRASADNITSILYIDTDPTVEKPDPGHVRLKTVVLPSAGVHHAILSDLGDGKPYLQSILQNKSTGVRLQAVVSVASGTGKAKSFFEAALAPLLQQASITAADYDVHYTTSDQSIIELVRQQILPAAQSGQEQAIILLSGDGGMIDVINVLFEQQHSSEYRPPNIAILPLGSGNALANSSKGQDDGTFGLRPLYNGFPKALPTFKATFSSGARLLVDEGRNKTVLPVAHGEPLSYGAVVASWGFHASLVADSDTTEYRKHGSARFQMAAKEALFPADGSPPHAYRGTVRLLPAGAKPENWLTLPETEYAYVLATYMSQLEAGFTISPSSKPLDGKLYLIRFGALKGDEIMDIMQKAYQGGKHVDDPRVSYQEIDGLHIIFKEADERWRRVCIDGKIFSIEDGGWVEVRKNTEPAVNLIAS